MNFRKVEVEDDLDDMEFDELVSLVREFNKAQSANIDTFDEVVDTVEAFNEYDEKLTEKVSEKTSLSEDAASSLPFEEKRSLIADFEETASGDEGANGGDDGDGGSEFEDRGTRGETHGEDGTPEVVEAAFSEISGAVLE